MLTIFLKEWADAVKGSENIPRVDEAEFDLFDLIQLLLGEEGTAYAEYYCTDSSRWSLPD